MGTTSSHFTCPAGQYAIKCPDQRRKKGQCCEWYEQLTDYNTNHRHNHDDDDDYNYGYGYDDKRRSLPTTTATFSGQGQVRALDEGKDGVMVGEVWLLAGVVLVLVGKLNIRTGDVACADG
jgi:hypothetical protein